MSQTFVIAEPGSTHLGRRDQMLVHISYAKAAGADAIKFQWVSDPAKLAARRQAPEYAEAYRLIAFPRRWLEELAGACQQAGLDFLCTAYLAEDLPVIAPLVRQFKVASFEATDQRFLEAHAAWPGIPIILSTGMMDIHDAARAAAACGNLGGVLHCVSCYAPPIPEEQVHLGAIGQLRRLVAPCPVGFSDHTRSLTTGGLAVAAGAQILEVHVRLEGTPLDNPDALVAHGPYAFKQYVDFVRKAERMVGGGAKRPQPCEEPMMRYRVVSSEVAA